MPPSRVRIYERTGHFVLQWWDKAQKRNLCERIDGDLVAAITRARQIDGRLEHFRSSGVGVQRAEHTLLVERFQADLRSRADAGEIDPRTVRRYESASITKLLDKILKEQQKIDRHEGDVVASHIRLGHHLADLRALAKRTWAKQLKAIGLSPRVARRYLKIAQHWPNEIGLNESDLLPRLPPDLLEL